MLNSGFLSMHGRQSGSDDSGSADMSLPLRRNMEIFFRLLDWRSIRPSARIEVQNEMLRIYLTVEGERLLLTLARSLPLCGVDHVLQGLLLRAQPEISGGLPIRVFRIDDQVHVSATLPEHSSAHCWLRTYRCLRQLLAAYRTAT